MSELRWGVMSTADIGRQKVIPGFQKAARTRVVAIASREPGRATELATKLAIPTAHGSYEALLADPQVDAVYIPLPNHLHREWTLAAAAAGKHVLCEKPLALTSADAERMVGACADAGVQLMEAFMYRHHPSWQAVFELVRDGQIGQLKAVQSWFSYFNDDPTNIRNIADYGGGALYDIGCYCVNLSRLLFGREPVQVSGTMQRDAATGVDVMTSGVLDFGDGTADFSCSTRTSTDQRVHVYGTRGRISIGIPFNIPPDRPTDVFLTTGGTPAAPAHTERLTFATADPYTVQAEAFAAIVLDGAEPRFPPSDAVANLVVMERLMAAALASG